MRLISNVKNNTTILWNVIIKNIVLSTLSFIKDVKKNINDGYKTIKIFSTFLKKEVFFLFG